MDFEPGRQTLTNAGVQELLKEVRMRAQNGNPPIRGIAILRTMRAKNNGFPKIMSHAELDPVMIYKEEEQVALEAEGYSENYIPRAYPKMLFRRNMHPRFHKSPEELTRILQLDDRTKEVELATTNEHDFIERVTVASAEQEAKLKADEEAWFKKHPKRKDIGPWCAKITDIEAFPEGPDEDPAVTVARMEGELAEARRQLSERKGKAAA